MTETPLHASDAMDAAWAAYREGVEEVRRMILSHPFASGPRERAEAQYLLQQLQAEAFNFTVAPRPDFPRFYTLFEPLTHTWGVPNPDFSFSRTYLDGRRTYRISGKRNPSLFILMQSINGHLTLPPEELKFLGAYDMDKFDVAPDGAFELIASAEPQPRNWIRLDPDARRNVVIVREGFRDWETAVPTQMRVEAIDEVEPQPMIPTEQDMIQRLGEAVRFMKNAAGPVSIGVVDGVVRDAGGWNKFVVAELGVASGAAPEATYNILAYDLNPDKALILEIDPPKSRYWGVQLSDIWNQAIDYTYHQASLGMSQATIDSDNKVRVVVSQRDPGFRNWVTPVDSRKGTVLVRWYLAEGRATPTAKLVPFDEVESHLPKGSARISAEERHTELRRRRAAIGRRYNW
jgi:hypothetical protein